MLLIKTINPAKNKFRLVAPNNLTFKNVIVNDPRHHNKTIKPTAALSASAGLKPPKQAHNNNPK